MQYPRWRTTSVLGTFLALAGLAGLFAYLNPDVVRMVTGRTPGGQARVKQPNVLLISIDMLRADHVHAYGNPHENTPSLDRLAAEGVLFENQISATSWTLPAHASMFTSLPPTVHGCITDERRLSSAFPTIAQKFKDAGYATAGFFSGPYLNPAFGLDHGFDHYENCTSYRDHPTSRPGVQAVMSPEIDIESHRDVTSPTVLASVRSWMKQRDKRPFFMFVHWFDAHYDFIPPPPYDTKFDPNYAGRMDGRDFFYDPQIRPGMDKRDLDHLLALYDGEIAWTDRHIGQLLDDLRAANLLDQTIVVVTSDHGTEFFEHGFKGHRRTLYDEALHVPLIMRFPSVLPEGVRRAAQTRLVDVAPTILELAGLPPFEMTRGRSLVSLARTGVAPSDGALAFCDLSSFGTNLRAIRTQDWKLIQDLSKRTLEFYQLKQDPGELVSTATDGNPDFVIAAGQFQQALASVRQLSAQAERMVAAAESKNKKPSGPARVPDAVQRQLRSLGYLDDDRNQSPPSKPGDSAAPESVFMPEESSGP